MKKIICYTLLSLLTCIKTQAQSFYGTKEWGLVSGGSLYFGDLNDRYGFQEIHPAVGTFSGFILTHIFLYAHPSCNLKLVTAMLILVIFIIKHAT
mgnify:CR=1 FL=1